MFIDNNEKHFHLKEMDQNTLQKRQFNSIQTIRTDYFRLDLGYWNTERKNPKRIFVRKLEKNSVLIDCQSEINGL